MPQLSVPTNFEQCPHLKTDKHRQCKVYEARPHSCRLYPFHYNPQSEVGYLEDATKVCPGFYLGDSIDELLPTLKEIAAEAKEGIAYFELATAKLKSRIESQGT